MCLCISPFKSKFQPLCFLVCDWSKGRWRLCLGQIYINELVLYYVTMINRAGLKVAIFYRASGQLGFWDLDGSLVSKWIQQNGISIWWSTSVLLSGIHWMRATGLSKHWRCWNWVLMSVCMVDVCTFSVLYVNYTFTYCLSTYATNPSFSSDTHVIDQSPTIVYRRITWINHIAPPPPPQELARIQINSDHVTTPADV